MKFGVTTNAAQIEGGVRSSWWEWASSGKIGDGTDPYVACEHYKRTEEDARLLVDLGLKHYRMGVEWARIEPQEGCFDELAMRHYADEITCLREKGIEVTVTLHCFSNPMWFEHSGAFERSDCAELFARYAAYVCAALDGLVTDFVTFNEPNTYAVAGYVYGIFPPGVKKKGRAKRVMSNLCACHINAYCEMHRLREQKGLPLRVGASLQYKVLQPKYRSSLSDAIHSGKASRLYQRSLALAMFKGIFLSPLRRPRGAKIARGKYYDFTGVSYFTRTVVNRRGHEVKEDVPVSDMGIEIYPEGLGKVLRAVAFHFGDAPISILANGVADASDAFRCRFICEHLQAIRQSGVEVEAYYYYSLLDGFEWLDGIVPKYGLYRTDFGTQQRILRASGEFYRAVAAAGEVTDELYNAFVAQQTYKTN